MSDMEERVARAIARECCVDYDRKDTKMVFDGYARAAIEAMRAPNEPMGEAALKIVKELQDGVKPAAALGKTNEN